MRFLKIVGILYVGENILQFLELKFFNIFAVKERLFFSYEFNLISVIRVTYNGLQRECFCEHGDESH